MSTIDDISKLFKRLREQRSIGATISEIGPKLEERARELVEKKKQAAPEPVVEQPSLEKLEDGVYQDEQGSLFSVDKGKVLPFSPKEDPELVEGNLDEELAKHREKKAMLAREWDKARDAEDQSLMAEIANRMDDLDESINNRLFQRMERVQAQIDEIKRQRDVYDRRASFRVVKEGEELDDPLREPTDQELLRIQEEEIELNQPEMRALYDLDIEEELRKGELPDLNPDLAKRQQELMDRFFAGQMTEEEFIKSVDDLIEEAKREGHQPTTPQEPQTRAGEWAPLRREDYKAKAAGIELFPTQRIRRLADGFHEDKRGRMFQVSNNTFVKVLSDEEAQRVRTELVGHPWAASLNLPLNAPGERISDDTPLPNTTPQVDPIDARIEELMRLHQEKYGPPNPDLERELNEVRKLDAEALEMRSRMLDRDKAKPKKEKKPGKKKVVESAKVKHDTRTQKEKDDRLDELRSISISADIPMDPNFLRRLSDFDLQETFQRVFHTDFNKLNIPEPSEEEQRFLITPILREMERRGFIK